jgi:RNA polymerase subunit RPABC4/transcription elongation factor Spt4
VPEGSHVTTCANCGATVDEAADDRCASCSAPLKVACPKCGELAPEDEVWCPACGTSLAHAVDHF